MTERAIELANAFIHAGELDDARQALDAHLQSHPADDAARRLLIDVLMRLPVPVEDIRRQFDELSLLNAADFLRLSLVCERAGSHAEAYAALEAAAARQPDDAAIADRRISLLRQIGDFEQARALVAAQPRSWRWLQLAGELACEVQDYPAAIESFNVALDYAGQMFAPGDRWGDSVRLQLLLGRAGAALALGMLEQADADYTAAAVYSDDPLIAFNRGLAAALGGNLTEALALCGAALADAPPALQAHMSAVLRADGRYAGLAALLLQGENDS